MCIMLNKQGDNIQTYHTPFPMEPVSCSTSVPNYCFLKEKAMTNLDSILKSRDITLLTKVRLVKAMVFPVVMYGCES